ncbi:hypothetical protein SAMN04487969_11463 [Paenibacillus algorifonticola]|uniref:DUF6199 domain-containing protein n=1 Tax=Paenibacillus algorifonticola TaxID=684063 RepID=A0A1I2G0L3_9BACL|nr:DUF6199 family natural product biosynthesis protein [Paenibacillus algorifonticola]SFF11092.1 hypothetical protein SAMN04487969_11463 [Paenibacillus algorifonticola]
MLFIGILLICFGLLLAVRPALAWSLTESWKSNDGTEPSSLYPLSTRFGGILCTLAGLGAILAYLA